MVVAGAYDANDLVLVLEPVADAVELSVGLLGIAGAVGAVARSNRLAEHLRLQRGVVLTACAFRLVEDGLLQAARGGLDGLL
ncbi:hypothetical protein D3C72_2382760 [compost metagenome]